MNEFMFYDSEDFSPCSLFRNTKTATSMAERHSTLSNARTNPYDRPPKDERSESEKLTVTSVGNAAAAPDATPSGDPALSQALADRTPTRPAPKQRFLNWRDLTRERIDQFIKLGDPEKSKDTSTVLSFAELDLDGLAKDLEVDPKSIDLFASGNRKPTICTPRMSTAFGLDAKYRDEKTGNARWTISVQPNSYQGCDPQEELDEFEAWFKNVWKPAIVEKIVEKAVLWDANWEKKSVEFLRESISDSLQGGFKKSTDPQYRDRFECKLKLQRGSAEEPLVRVWDEETKQPKAYSLVLPRDLLRVIAYFEGVCKVSSSFYQRWMTQEMIHGAGGGPLAEDVDESTLPFPMAT